MATANQERDDRLSVPEASRSGQFVSSSADAPRGGEVGLVAILNAVLQRRILVATIAVSVALLTGAFALFRSRTYTAEASLAVELQSTPSFAGLAAQYGIRVPDARSGPSAEFFAYLVRSRTLLTPVLRAQYSFIKGEKAVRTDLVNELTDANTPASRRLDQAISALRESLSTSIDKETRIITVGVTMGSADLAEQVLANLLLELDRFNSERHKSQAEVVRRFTESQMESAHAGLTIAEDALQQFREQNRITSGSPELAFRQDRLTREIARRQQLYTALSQAFDEARIDEVRSVPAVTIVEAPMVPSAPNRRGALKRTLIALILGAMAGASLALLLELAGPASGTRADLAELNVLWRATLRDLRHPINAILRTRVAQVRGEGSDANQA